MKRLTPFFFVLVLLLNFQLFSQSKTPIKSKYLFGSANFMLSWLPDPLALRQFGVMRIPGVTHIPLHIDVGGFYVPRNDKTLWGGVMEVTIERYSTSENWFQIETYQPSFSVFYFLDQNICANGMFARCDVGPAILRIASGDAGWEYTRFGFGFLVSTGYVFNIQTIPFTISAQYSQKIFSGKSHHFASFGPGVFF